MLTPYHALGSLVYKNAARSLPAVEAHSVARLIPRTESGSCGLFVGEAGWRAEVGFLKDAQRTMLQSRGLGLS